MIPAAAINFSYIVASVLFIYGLKMLSSQTTARRGNMLSACGMLLAIVVTLLKQEIVSFQWIAVGAAGGAVIGAACARLIKMTSMPEMVALFNGFGGIASLLVGWSEYHARPESPIFTITAIFVAVLIGGMTFSGSIIAWGKLSESISGKPVLFAGQKVVTAVFLGGNDYRRRDLLHGCEQQLSVVHRYRRRRFGVRNSPGCPRRGRRHAGDDRPAE